MNIRRWRKRLFHQATLIATLGSMLAGRVAAQTFSTPHSFTADTDGAYPTAGLVLSGNALYGTASRGGSSDNGAVFSINTDGTGFTNLHSFSGINDGSGPNSLVLLSNTLYGTASGGGGSNCGTIFALNASGTGFSNLHNFSGGQDGVNPSAGLTMSGNSLYGTTQGRGISSYGTVFALNTDGTGFTNLHVFDGTNGGGGPAAEMVLSGNALYGTTLYAGENSGTIFTINTDGTGFMIRYYFGPSGGWLDPPYIPPFWNFDGGDPTGLILSGRILFGTASILGHWGAGSVFMFDTGNTGFNAFKVLSWLASTWPPASTDGANPSGKMALWGTTLYGTAQHGGAFGKGAVFAVNTDGTGYTNLYSFSGGNDGGNPVGGLILSGTSLYGTTQYGGSSGAGTVFSISFLPRLSINHSGQNFLLTWPTNYAGFDFAGYTLQSTTNLGSPWIPDSLVPTIINGQNTVTNPISGTSRFFRLSQ